MSEPTPCPHCGRPMLPGPILACHTPGCPNNLGSALGEQSLIADLRAERDDALRVNAEQGERLRTAQARVAELERLLATTGTLRERQSRLAEIAKVLGFNRVNEAFWETHDEEYPLEDVYASSENGDVGEVVEVNLGLFLGVSVHTTCRWSDGCGGDEGGDVEYACFDTHEEAEAWVAERTKGESR